MFVLKNPVATVACMTCFVRAGRNIGIRQCGDSVDKALPLFTAGKFTAIKQNVSVRVECLLP